MAPAFLARRRVEGGGPRYVRVSARAIRYRRRDLDQWIADRLRLTTREPVPDDAA